MLESLFDEHVHRNIWFDEDDWLAVMLSDVLDVSQPADVNDIVSTARRLASRIGRAVVDTKWEFVGVEVANSLGDRGEGDVVGRIAGKRGGHDYWYANDV